MRELTAVTLRDGTEAVIVPLLPVHREALQEGYEHLSSQTRFERFLTAMPHLTEPMLDHLVDEVDGVNHIALVLLVMAEDGTEVPVGLGRVIRYPDDPTAGDVAVTVVDAWQGRGVAAALVEALMRDRPSGLERLVTVVEATNEPALKLLAHLGPVEVTGSGSGTLQVQVDLTGRGREAAP